MTSADITLAVFTLCNSLRVLAYLPQIAKAATDRNGVEAVSFATWGLFLFSNVSAIAYALVNKGDWVLAAMFLGNAVGCAAILLVGAWKRARHRRRSRDEALYFPGGSACPPPCRNRKNPSRRAFAIASSRRRACA